MNSRLTEQEARTAIIGNGYLICSETKSMVIVRKPGPFHLAKQWLGVNFRDLALSFGLHETKANKGTPAEGRSRFTNCFKAQ